MILVSDALKYTNTLNTMILYWAPWCYPTRWQQIWLINVWNKHASMHLNLDCNEFGVKKRGILRTLIFLVWYWYCFHLFCEKTTLVSWVKHLVSGHISSSSHMSRALYSYFLISAECGTSYSYYEETKAWCLSTKPVCKWSIIFGCRRNMLGLTRSVNHIIK